MPDSLRILWDIFTAKKYDLVNKNINGTYTSDNVSRVLWGEIIDPNSPGNMPIDNTAVNLSIKKLLELQGIDIESLEWKKILDIWGWFTGLPFLLNEINTEVNIVDPIFSSDILFETEKNKKKLLWLVERFDEKNYKAYEKWDYERQEYLYNLNYEFNNIFSDLTSWENTDITNNSFSVWKTKVNIYSTTWENISWIENESQDLIFINHTITKNQVNPYILLNKAYELLKVGWKMYITESWKLDLLSFEMWNEEFNVEVIDSYYLNDKTILILEKS